MCIDMKNIKQQILNFERKQTLSFSPSVNSKKGCMNMFCFDTNTKCCSVVNHSKYFLQYMQGDLLVPVGVTVITQTCSDPMACQNAGLSRRDSVSVEFDFMNIFTFQK